MISTIHRLFHGRNKSVYGYKDTDKKKVEERARKWGLPLKEKHLDSDMKILLRKSNYVTSKMYSFSKISTSRRLFDENKQADWYFTDNCYVIAKLAYYFCVDKKRTESLISLSRRIEKYVGIGFYSELI